MADDWWRHSLPGTSGLSSSRGGGDRRNNDEDDDDEDDDDDDDDDSDNNQNYGIADESSDDDRSESPLFGRQGFPHLEPTDLAIVQEQLNDMFVGVASKTRFSRAAGQADLRFLFDSEYDLYLRRFVMPRLRSIFSGGRSYFVWLSVKLRFQKISDPTDFMDFWSVFRNKSWFLSWVHSSAEREQFLRHIISEWSDDVYTDIAQMCSQESGWSFYAISCVDVRVAENTPSNLLRFAGSANKNRPFHPLLKNLFHKLVVDPSPFLRQGFAKDNYCVPACILLALHNRLGPPIRTMNVTKIEAELPLLNFSGLLQVSRPGISLSQLSALEKRLSPVPSGLLRVFPALAIYRGISLNLFTVRRADGEFRLFPTSLSQHSRDNNFFSVDMIVDNDDIREVNASNTSHPRGVLHCLLVLQLARLVNKFSHCRSNVSKYTHICRVCMKTFYSTASKLEHFQICDNKKRGVCGKRRVRNQLIHRPYRINRFTLKKEQDGLSFQRSKCARLLKPLSFSCLDFEQIGRKIDKSQADASDFERTPSSAISVQAPLSYSIQHRSLYPEIPLPANLASPRIKFINRDDPTPEKTFFLSLLYTIREDLLFHSRFIQDLLSHDQGPPPLHQRTSQQLAYMYSIKRCEICNVRFGSRKKSPKTGAYYPVRRCFDHHHFLENSSQIRAVTCQGCNLSFSCERYDANMTWACHYGSKYDHLLVLRALLEYGSKEVITYTRQNGTTYRRKLLKGEPRAIFKSENEIISLSFKFTCPFELCACRMSREEREHLKLEERPLRPCPFARKIRFIDTFLFTNCSLDKMITGLHQARVKEGLPLDQAFYSTVRYARSLHLSPRQTEILISKKLTMPFEALTTVEAMINQTTCPPPSYFKSVLKGKKGLTAQEMNDFRQVWDECNVQNLYQLFTWYNILDTCQMADATAFYMGKLHAVCGLHPLHFLTISSLSLASMLYNCRSPDNRHRRLFLPFLSQEIYEFFEANLCGGYSTNQGFWAFFNGGFFSLEDQENNDFVCSGELHDYNGLYATVMQTFLPYKEYQLWRKADNNVMFAFIAQKLMEGDVQFFRDKIVEERIAFYVEVRVGYDFSRSLGHSLDLGTSPRFYRVDPSQLSASQQAYLRDNKRKLDKEPPKLCSFHQQDTVLVDFVDCLLYFILNHSVIVLDVLTIVQYKCADFMYNYMQMLQDKRSKTTSDIESKMVKALGNCVSGKLHQKTSSYYDIRICTSKTQFLRYLQRSNFWDYRYLSATSCLILQDEKIIKNHNICSIPERVYKYSKILVWNMFFYITGRMGYFANSHARLCFMDTDSFFMSYQRPRSAFEIEEVNTLLATNQRIPFYQSLTAQRMTTHYLSTFGSILDWSSISQNHYVRQTLLHHYPHLEAQLDFLALKTKNQPFLVKDESGGQVIKQIITSSPKQYIVTSSCEEDRNAFPVLSRSHELLSKKVKGFPQSRQKEIKLYDFVNVTMDNKKARKVMTASFKKTYCRIYLVTSKRKTLTRFSCKRIFDDAYKTKGSYFSFPLNWKRIL